MIALAYSIVAIVGIVLAMGAVVLTVGLAMLAKFARENVKANNFN